jgi:hypothetical protein
MTKTQLKQLIREEIQSINKVQRNPIQKEALDDLDVNLPANVDRFLNKLTTQIQGLKLPRKKEILIIAKLIDAMNMDKQDVARAIQKIKQADAFGGQKKMT